LEILKEAPKANPNHKLHISNLSKIYLIEVDKISKFLKILSLIIRCNEVRYMIKEINGTIPKITNLLKSKFVLLISGFFNLKIK